MNPDTAVQDGIDEVPLCLAWSKRGGICGQKLPCDGSLHRGPTFEEQVDSHFARLEAERTPSVALVEERTEEREARHALNEPLIEAFDALRTGDHDGPLPHLAPPYCGVCSPYGGSDPERTGVSDVQHAVREEVAALRVLARYYMPNPDGRNDALARLDRIEMWVRGEQR